MNETVITVVGYVATEPTERVTAVGARVVSFRLASTERRFDKNLNGWRDVSTTFYTVSCWRNTAENAFDSVAKGDPVIVHGKLRHSTYEKEGQTRSVLEIDASALGHDIAKGVSRFTKATPLPSRPEVVLDDDEQVGQPAPSGPGEPEDEDDGDENQGAGGTGGGGNPMADAGQISDAGGLDVARGAMSPNAA